MTMYQRWWQNARAVFLALFSLTHSRALSQTLSWALSRGLVLSIVLTSVVAFSMPSWATGLQTGQFPEQSAILVGPREDAPIALYIRPAPNQQPVGYGISGDPVTIFDQFGDFLMEDDPSATWSHIRLEKAPYTEGWLRGKFLAIPPSEQPSGQSSESMNPE